MPTGLNTFPLQSPGSLGLNTEDQDSVIDHRYATVAFNCVLSRNGRIEARKGWDKLNSTPATGDVDLDVVHSYVSDSGTEVLVSAGGNKLWSGDTSLTDRTGTVSVTADNWQFQNTQGNVIGCQALHEPIWWDGSGNFEYLVDQNNTWQASTTYTSGDVVVPTTRNGYYYECTTAGDSDATEPATWSTTIGGTTNDNTAVWTTREIPKSNVLLTAFGRSWFADANGTTLYYSDLLIPHKLSGGSSGSIDLNTVWPTSNDNITALAVHNNNLIIFCQNSVVVYGGADNIDTISLVEVITNIGCVARDSVQNIGEEVLWLSNEGVRSLSRTVLQDNMPLGTLSGSVRTEIIGAKDQETDLNTVRSVYNESEGLYLILFTNSSQVYAFDVRLLQQGIIRPFIWDSIAPLGCCTRKNNDLVFSFTGGFLGKYNGYLDDTATYIMKYRSGWIDPGSQGMEMIWKNMRVYLNSTYSLSSTASWGYDFETAENTQQKSITATDVSEYGIAEYGIAEYGSGTTSTELDFELTDTGEIVRVGFQAVINSGKIGINKITLQAKRGKLN